MKLVSDHSSRRFLDVVVDRHWNIFEDEKPDTVIFRVQVIKAPNGVIRFGLKTDSLKSLHKLSNEEEMLPFRIDPKSGIVRLHDKLDGRGGETFTMWLTATDKFYMMSHRVIVHIKPKNERKMKAN